jgi:sugar/nucleoside kinase (ribokinase family)
VNQHLHFDYTTLGHVTVDVLPDGSSRPGGTAFYSALQAARLGKRALIITRGSPRGLEQLLEPYLQELELRVVPAPATTTLSTTGTGETRRQRMLAWAGPLSEDIEVDSTILHLAPVARETPARWGGRADFVGLTPQGLVREWPPQGGDISLRAADGTPGRELDAIVLSAEELASCGPLISAARAEGALVAVTAGARPTMILLPDGGTLELAVAPIEGPHDDLGAGDVFAAAFFVSLQGGATPERAAAFANAAAAVRVLAPGPAAIGTRAAIESRLRAVAEGAD